jgi:hypothetical protein
MPVPVQFFGAGKDTVVVFNHSFSGEMFTANLGFIIDSIKFDPDQRLVSANNSVSLGKDDLPAGKTFTLAPNPASDFLIIEHNLGAVQSFELLTMEGKSASVEMEEAGAGRLKTDIRKLKTGMYLLRIKFDEGTITRKFMVSR